MRFTSIVSLSIGLLSMTAYAAPAAAPNTSLVVRGSTDVAIGSDPEPDTSVSVDTTAQTTGGGTDIADALLTIAHQVNVLVGQMIAKDNEKRAKFTQQVVARARGKRGDLNWIICNVGYSFNGNAAVRTRLNLDIKVGTKVTYDVIGFSSGIFDRQGDGGYTNWAYAVNSRCVRKGGHIHC